MTQTVFTTTDEMTPLECFDWLVAVYVDRGFPARPASPAGLRVAKVRSALNPEQPLTNTLQDKRQMTEQTESLLLKWGTLKGYNVSTDASKAALQKYFDYGVCVSAAMQRDSDAQKSALCELIDAIQGEIQNDWTGEMLTKDQAKAYVLEYGK